MTDANATPQPKKITRKRPLNFPRQVCYMVPGDLADAIKADAEREGTSRSEIARRYLQAGRAITDAAEAVARD